MSDPLDWREFRDAIRITREIMRQPALDHYRGRELHPGADLTTDAELDAFVRARAETAFHPSCSCKMGYDDMAVVDDEGRVHGRGSAARRRCVDHAADHHGQSQRADDHARRKDRGQDSRT